MLANGQVKDQAEIARVAGITRARVSQILNLTNLAPDIQQAILEFDPTISGSDHFKEHHARSIVREASWERQRTQFRKLSISR